MNKGGSSNIGHLPPMDVFSKHESCCPENSRALYSLLRDGTCARPPEIVALFNIPSGDSELSSMPNPFDSHPRPHLHPRGATFIRFPNEEGPVEYLSSLFQRDKALVESKPWDASLLGQYTAHVLKLKMSTPAAHELAFYQANIRVLAEQASLREAKDVLSAEVASLRRQVDRAMAAETASSVVSRESAPPPRKPTAQNHEPSVSQGWKHPVGWKHFALRNNPMFRQRYNGGAGSGAFTPPPLLWRGFGMRTSNESDEPAVSQSWRLPVGWVHPALRNNPMFRQRYNGGAGSGAFTPPPLLWRGFGMRTSNESEKAHPNEEVRADERARQQNARQGLPRRRGRGKNIPPKNPTPNTSERPAHLPATSSRPPLPKTPPPKTPPPKATPSSTTTWLAQAFSAQFGSWNFAQGARARESGNQEHRRPVQKASKAKSFDCVICMDTYIMDFSAPIRSCGHVLCRDCMKEHVQSQVSQSIWPIRCPTCVADHSRTEDHGVITRDLVETLGIDEVVMARWVKLEMEWICITIQCPRCHNTAAVDLVDFQKAKNVTCPLGCGAQWCKQCNQNIDPGRTHSCDGQAEMDYLLGQKDWKKCPACQVPVEKVDQGCNHMTCRCNCHFCYICGGEITRSVNRRDIERELQVHYRKDCKLFEYPE